MACDNCDHSEHSHPIISNQYNYPAQLTHYLPKTWFSPFVSFLSLSIEFPFKEKKRKKHDSVFFRQFFFLNACTNTTRMGEFILKWISLHLITDNHAEENAFSVYIHLLPTRNVFSISWEKWKKESRYAMSKNSVFTISSVPFFFVIISNQCKN